MVQRQQSDVRRTYSNGNCLCFPASHVASITKNSEGVQSWIEETEKERLPFLENSEARALRR